jgi:hypothetical protein
MGRAMPSPSTLILLLYFSFSSFFVTQFISQNLSQSRARNCTLTDWWLHLLALRTKINGTASGSGKLLHGKSGTFMITTTGEIFA